MIKLSVDAVMATVRQERILANLFAILRVSEERALLPTNVSAMTVNRLMEVDDEVV